MGGFDEVARAASCKRAYRKVLLSLTTPGGPFKTAHLAAVK